MKNIKRATSIVNSNTDFKDNIGSVKELLKIDGIFSKIHVKRIYRIAGEVS